MKKVAIVMGSDSDLPIVKKAAQVLKDFGVPTELRVLSAHRCAAEVSEFARNAEKALSLPPQAKPLTLPVLSQVRLPCPLSAFR